MLTSPEINFQQERIKQLIVSTDQLVWQNEAFPAVHRPDLDVLIPKITIADFLDVSWIIPHPEMKKDWLNNTEIAQKGLVQKNKLKIALYDGPERSISLRTILLGQRDTMVRRVLAHELATDKMNRNTIIPSTDYSLEDRNTVKDSLALVFDKKRRPRVDQTELLKSGFERTILYQNYGLSNIYGPYAEITNEIYPTMMEIIVDQVVMRRGDINGFDQALKNGKISIPMYEDHPKFAKAFLLHAESVNWRIMLDAFSTGDYKQLWNVLTSELDEEQAKNVYDDLYTAMENDEKGIEETVFSFEHLS